MTAEQQGLREREEQWNRASEIPDTILHRQSKSEAMWAQEKHWGLSWAKSSAQTWGASAEWTIWEKYSFNSVAKA